MLDTLPKLQNTTFPALNRDKLTTVQVNLGYRCNQQCNHCHVNAGPKRTEMMSQEVIDDILEFLRLQNIQTLDLTGGAPEMNEHFRYLVSQARAMNIHVMDRCNLTILEEPGYEELAAFLAEQGVEIISSLPCYLEENVDAQRGKGVYGISIRALKRLNVLGYGIEGSEKVLNLVYNPTGPSLPPSQVELEQDYKKQLKEQFGISFNQLYTLTNMPIARFGSSLLSKGQFEDYMQTLRDSYQSSNLSTVMCRNLISIDWQGYVYDCDFNQMLNLPMQLGTNRQPRYHVRELSNTDFNKQSIAVLEHCYGCTAGQGSSCGGALN
ncbi:MAG: arsenosugar biosynthesis radical SAM protein ArsS [Gammaproteobacteria bacterium]|nr:arsenosugar biosynthesis radical SAM protein ArsS [Gammaproteobacteria bacterium]